MELGGRTRTRLQQRSRQSLAVDSHQLVLLLEVEYSELCMKQIDQVTCATRCLNTKVATK